METLGEFLKLQRKKIKLTLRDIENKIGVSNSYLSQLENNKILQPSPSVLYKLAKFYTVSYDRLMKLSGYPVVVQFYSQKDIEKFSTVLDMDTREDRRNLKEIVIEVLSRVEEHLGSNEEAEDESKSLANIFITFDGRKFGNQVQDLQEFTIKCISMTVFNAISSYFPKILKSPEFMEMVEKAELDQEERNFFVSLKSLIEKSDFSNEFNQEQLFTSDDLRRFIGGFVFGLYSYSEVFIDTIIDRTFNIIDFGKLYISYLEKRLSKSKKLSFSTDDMDRYLANPVEYSSEKGKDLFKENVKRNPFDKQITLLSVFQMKDVLKGIFHDLNAVDYLDKYFQFKKTRDRIAHGDPDPSLSIFNSDSIKDRIKEISLSWNEASDDISPDPKKEKIAYTITKIAEEIIRPLQKPFAIIQEISEASIVLPAIIERFLLFKGI